MLSVIRLACFVLLMFSQGSCYVTRQALKQNSLYNSRVHIQKKLDDPKTPEDIRTKLLHIQDVKDYAKKNGLYVGGSYNHYIEQSGRPVSFLVFAAEPFELKSRTWWFPIVGDVPYLGFFAEEDRDEQAIELEAEGLDVYRGKAAAFSSLGWFDDPIFSSMLERRRAAYTHLIFHELTHQTYWAPGTVLFNENLAEYVAYRLSIGYFKDRNLPEIMDQYETYRRDRKNYKVWLAELRKTLVDVYASEEFKALSLEDKNARKQQIFDDFKNNKKPKSERFNFVSKKIVWNNAKVLASSLYSPELEIFEKADRCSGSQNIGEFLKALEEVEPETPEEMLEKLCRPDSKNLSEGI